MRKLLLILLAVSGIGFGGERLAAQDRSGPSFDCGLAKGAIETAICSDGALTRADRTMAALYAEAQVSAYGPGKSSQQAVQRVWLKGRAECLRTAVDKRLDTTLQQCLLREYRLRNGDLAVATLFVEPQRALAVLREVDPEAAPLYEAVHLYVTSGTAQRARLIELIGPFLTELKIPENNYGALILEDTIKRPADAIASDTNFALFLKVSSAYLDDEPQIPRPFPCAALVRRPGLIDAVGPVFGSTLDNFIFTDDCDSTLPLQPRLQALTRALETKFWPPECDQGAVRFLFYRIWYTTVTSAQIGLPLDHDRPAPQQLGRKGLSPALVNAAVAELTDQYQRYRGLAAGEAKRRAASWVDAVVKGAGQCEMGE